MKRVASLSAFWSVASRWDVAMLVLLGLCGLGCHSGGGEDSFPKGQEPKVEFFQLDIAGRVQRVTDPTGTIRAYLRIANRSEKPIKLTRVRARLRGNISAVTTTDVPSAV